MEKKTRHLIPVHIGLMGHIDAGKTAIARCFTEIISTAGLDKHSQSQERGITIDLGFTFFQLDQYMITLVDAPGHADLIRSVVSAARIIDMAILVIDATKGPQVQTGEHLLILDMLEIPYVIVLLNKIDLISEIQISILEEKIHEIFKQTRYHGKISIYPVSARKCEGFKLVKQNILNYLNKNPVSRNISGNFKFLFDHHFLIKGKGTILTGTVLSGTRNIGESITILPLNQQFKIKSIQKWKTSTESIQAGDRCGIAVKGLNPDSIHRGDFAVDTLKPFVKCQILHVNLKISKFFDHSCKFGQNLTVIHNMKPYNSKIYPVLQNQMDDKLILEMLPDSKEKKEVLAFIWLEEEGFFQKGDDLLIMRMDLPPKQLRIVGIANILSFEKPPITIYRKKVKIGKVIRPNYSINSVIVKNLAQSIKGAQFIMKYNPDPPFTQIIAPFGSKGLVEVKYNKQTLQKITQKSEITEGFPISVKILKQFTLDFSKSYHL
ncbi:MAG: selenocysteine-specific translation elongation factor [Promethearchaeota archaeon]